MITVTIYDKPACGACDATKRAFTKAEVPFEVQSLEDPEVLETMKARGHKAAPVVVLNETEFDNVVVVEWSGFRPEKIDEAISMVTNGISTDQIKLVSDQLLAAIVLAHWKAEAEENAQP